MPGRRSSVCMRVRGLKCVCVGFTKTLTRTHTHTHLETRDALFAVCSRLVSVFLLQLHFNV